MASWSCPSCGEENAGAAPTPSRPIRCGVCEVLVWPDGVYSHGKEDAPEVILATHVSAQVTSHLRARVTANGDLVVEGQDLGPLVRQMWDDDDYEYWITVSSVHVPHLVRSLAEKLDQSPSATDAPEATTGADEPSDEVGRVALTLLRKAFRDGVFTSDTDYRSWLEDAGIRSEFFSYA